MSEVPNTDYTKKNILMAGFTIAAGLLYILSVAINYWNGSTTLFKILTTLTGLTYLIFGVLILKNNPHKKIMGIIVFLTSAFWFMSETAANQIDVVIPELVSGPYLGMIAGLIILSNMKLPDWRKISLAIILLFVTSLYSTNIFGADLALSYRGLPLPYYECQIGYCTLPTILPYTGPTWASSIGVVELILDFIIWYIVSFFIIWLYDKFRNRK